MNYTNNADTQNFLIYQGKQSPLPYPNTPKIISNNPLQDSKYIELRKLVFEENGAQKTWDIVKSHDSVGILLYDIDKKGFIFVRQFRISVYLKNPLHGYMYELCAGLCDKNKSVEQIAIEELQEECGYCIALDKLQKINQFYSSVGMNGAKQHLFCAKVCKLDKKGLGGGNKDENENIELVFVPEKLIYEFLDDETCPKTQSLAYAIMWFYAAR